MKEKAKLFTTIGILLALLMLFVLPAIVFAAIVGILLNLIFLLLPPSRFGVEDRENINL